MDKQRLFDLIEKFKANTATEIEIEELDRLYNEFEQKPGYIGKLDEGQRETYREMVFGRIHAQINPAEQSAGVRESNIRKLFWTNIAAAVILIIAGIGIYFYTINRKVQPQIQIANDIAPGGNKAILMLANGRKIVLTDVRNGDLATENNMMISKTADGQVIYQGAHPKDSEMVYNTLSIPRGGQYTLILSDGTKVVMNASSSLKYPASFVGNERKVELHGEAYFEVSKNKAKPFKVISDGQTVEVLGTHFNINSYADEGPVRTTLLEGSVKVSTYTGSKIIKPGQAAVCSGNRLNVENANIEEAVAWKNGYFRFNNEKIESIMRELARWYNIDVVYKNKISDEGFYGKISRFKNISEVLKMLEDTHGVHFKMEGRRITVIQ